MQAIKTFLHLYYMKNLSYTFLLVLLCTACGNKNQLAPNAHSLALVIGNPVDYGLEGVLAFPVGANYNPKIKEAAKKDPVSGSMDIVNYASKESPGFSSNNTGTLYDRNASSEYINSNEQDFDIRNILFYDKLTGLSFPLIKDTLHILSFAIHKEFINPLIFYRVVKNDINKDSKYNSDDAVMLYTSDLKGKNFTQITPPNERFFDYFYYPETNTILIKTAIDIDKNNKFTELDETNFREMKIMSPQFGREIFSKSLKDSLRVQMNALK